MEASAGVRLAVPDDDAWRRLSSVTGEGWERDARFSTAVSRTAHAAALAAVLDAWARPQTAEALVARLQAAGVPAAVVATPADLADDPQLRARGWWRRVGGVARDGVVPRLRELQGLT